MRHTLSCILLLVMIGCGYGPADPSSCPLMFSGYISEERAAIIQQGAYEMMTQSGIIPEHEWCPAFSHVRILVRMDYQWKMDFDSAHVNGEFEFYKGIQLSPQTDYLVHELLHVWDSEHFAFGTKDHTHWHQNGYYDLDDKFTQWVFNNSALLHDPNVLNDPPVK